MSEPLKPWKCKSRMLPVGPCPYACEVETPFEPRACLKIFVAEEWEPAERRAPQPDALVEALQEAVGLIRFWHGQGHMAGAEPFLWEAYQQSPEMKRIFAALAIPRPERTYSAAQREAFVAGVVWAITIRNPNTADTDAEALRRYPDAEPPKEEGRG